MLAFISVIDGSHSNTVSYDFTALLWSVLAISHPFQIHTNIVFI